MTKKNKTEQILLVLRVERRNAVFFADGITAKGIRRQRHDCSHQEFIPGRGQIIKMIAGQEKSEEEGSDHDENYKDGTYIPHTGIPDELLVRYISCSQFFYGIGFKKIKKLRKAHKIEESDLPKLLKSASFKKKLTASCLTDRTQKCFLLGNKIMRWQQDCLKKGISYPTTQKFFDVYRWRTVEAFNENPFRILAYADTTKYFDLWKRIKNGHGSSESEAAALWAIFYDENTRYKTSIPTEELKLKLGGEFGIKAPVDDSIIEIACRNKYMVKHEDNYQLSPIFVFEKAIANYLKAFNAANKSELFKDEDYKTLIESIGVRDDLPEQEPINQFKAFSGGQMLLIYGNAGTGKTYISARILAQCASAGSAIRVVAVSNIAVSRVRGELEPLLKKHSIEAEVRYESVAKFLMPDVGKKDSRDAPKEASPYVLLLDEASMVGAGQALEIFGKLRDQDRLIMVGDPRQIPPIGWGALFHALEEDPKGVKFNRIHLTVNKRQGHEEHPILQMVKALGEKKRLREAAREGEMKSITIPADDEHDPLPQLDKYLNNFKRPLKDLPPILCFSREDVARVNWRVHQHLKKKKKFENMERWGNSELHAGEPVINVFNRREFDLWNGTRGRVIHRVIQDEDILLAEFPKSDGTKQTCQLDSGIERAYAVTVHRAQGEGHDEVIIFLGNHVPEQLLHRGSLYTAITRAAKKLIFIGSVEKFDEGYLRPNLARESNFLDFAFG